MKNTFKRNAYPSYRFYHGRMIDEVNRTEQNTNLFQTLRNNKGRIKSVICEELHQQYNYRQ